jgi:hypothetical protein
VAEIVYGILEEVAFRQLERQTGLLEEGKNLVHVMKVGLSRRGENNDIVQVHQAGFPLDTCEYNIHGTLEKNGSIPEPERKAGEPVEPMMGRKRGFVHINGVYRNLPVTAVAVQCGKYNGLSDGVNTFVHTR